MAKKSLNLFSDVIEYGRGLFQRAFLAEYKTSLRLEECDQTFQNITKILEEMDESFTNDDLFQKIIYKFNDTVEVFLKDAMDHFREGTTTSNETRANLITKLNQLFLSFQSFPA